MKRKNGFTLIELLAVIVILAIIALITTPTILGVIDKAKMGAAKSSALGYIDAVEKQVAINMLDNIENNDIKDGVHLTDTLNGTTYGVTVKGNKPETDSWLVIEKNQVVNYSFKIGEYIVSYDEESKDVVVTKGNTVLDQPEGVKTGPTMEAAKEVETHKGIVYLDPTDLTNTCSAENSISTTETKTGCMKWYIFDDNGDNYTMILDHNTTARIKWNDSSSNVAYESSNLKSVVDDLVTASGWEVTPRLISAEEINNITGKIGWTNTSSSYYFDTKTQTSGTFTETTRSKYDWLYNNLTLCKTDSTDYGCTLEDNNIYTGYGTAGDGNTWGYWTSVTLGSAGSGSTVWVASRKGYLGYDNANSANHGVRPVITISKSIVS